MVAREEEITIADVTPGPSGFAGGGRDGGFVKQIRTVIGSDAVVAYIVFVNSRSRKVGVEIVGIQLQILYFRPLGGIGVCVFGRYIGYSFARDQYAYK